MVRKMTGATVTHINFCFDWFCVSAIVKFGIQLCVCRLGCWPNYAMATAKKEMILITFQQVFRSCFWGRWLMRRVNLLLCEYVNVLEELINFFSVICLFEYFNSISDLYIWLKFNARVFRRNIELLSKVYLIQIFSTSDTEASEFLHTCMPAT